MKFYSILVTTADGKRGYIGDYCGGYVCRENLLRVKKFKTVEEAQAFISSHTEKLGELRDDGGIVAINAINEINMTITENTVEDLAISL